MFFTLPDFSDISLRDYQETMQRPFFSLSKRKRIKPIDYVSPDRTVTVQVLPNSAYGMATIWDADIMIYLASHLNEMRERGTNDISPVIRLQPGDLLKRICWGTSGRAYERLVSALDRLQATTIKTNIRASNKSRETTFSWIDSYTHLVDERTQRSLGMEITLSKWFFDGVMDKRNVLSISPLYFEITSGLGKWLYRASRKHAGGNGAEGFTIGFETLHQKSGSESSYPVFKRKLMELARHNELPDISLEVVDEDSIKPKLKMVMRRHLNPTKPRKRPLPSSSQSVEIGESDDTSDMSDDLIDPRLTHGIIAGLGKGLRVPLRHEGTEVAPKRSERRPARAPSPAVPPRANKVLDHEVYAAIRADFPGWDYDALMERFDTFLGSNPDELPRNYSKRFYGFVKEHHRRNKFRL
ncbi:replication initiator protein A (plasmid) [Sphingobium naphthae]|uniref:replication initiator protein A n=1 Tax=Sphingobium naphthae TaxID=1886786 RepID=UPI0037480D2B